MNRNNRSRDLNCEELQSYSRQWISIFGSGRQNNKSLGQNQDNLVKNIITITSILYIIARKISYMYFIILYYTFSNTSNILKIVSCL
jgi:hypothetical protein